MKEEKNNKNLDLSKINSKNNNSTNNQSQTNNKSNLDDSNESNMNPVDLNSSTEPNLNQSYLSNSDNKNSTSYFSKSLSFIKFSINEGKHGYKYYHQQIFSNPNIAQEIKDSYTIFYEDVEERINRIRETKKSKESIKAKLKPSFWSKQDTESQKLTDTLSQEVDELLKEKESLKNSLVFFQLILLKNLEKTTAFFNQLSGFSDNGINYIDIANRNSDSYKILELLKSIKYQEIIRNTEKFKSLNNNTQLQFLEFLASDSNNKDVANNLFGQNSNLRIDVFNHYINDEFWIEIYSSPEHQEHTENFYELYGRNNYDMLPKIPFWGIKILSGASKLDKNIITTIIDNFLQPNLPDIINDLGGIIDSYQSNNLNDISENHYNLISNMSSYLTYAEIALPTNRDESYANSIKKIQNFQSSYNNSTNSLYDTVENLSTIQISSSRPNNYDSSYEYYSHKDILNKTSLQYDVLCKYDNTPMANKLDLSYEKTCQYHYNKKLIYETKQVQKNLSIPTYEYIKIHKRYIKDSNQEKKLDIKGEEKNLNKDSSIKHQESPIPAFIKGSAATITAELIFFIIWSAYFYWHQKAIIMKITEEINRDTKKLLTIELPVLIIYPKKVKTIFDSIYDENDKESMDKVDLNMDRKLINIDKPIYDNKAKNCIIATPKIPEDILVTPLKEIHQFITLSNENLAINTNECANFEASNYNVDILEI